MSAGINNYIKKFLFRIRWLTMSQRERYAYLLNRTKNCSWGLTSQQTWYRSNGAASTMEGYAPKVEEFPQAKKTVLEVGGRLLNVIYHFCPQTDSDAPSELDYVRIDPRDWQALIEEVGRAYIDHRQP